MTGTLVPRVFDTVSGYLPALHNIGAAPPPLGTRSGHASVITVPLLRDEIVVSVTGPTVTALAVASKRAPRMVTVLGCPSRTTIGSGDTWRTVTESDSA